MRIQKYLIIALTALTFCLTLSTRLLAQVYYTESGRVEFHCEVPLHSFTGHSNYLVGKINLKTGVVDFYVDVYTLKTGIGMRDDDMLETLEAEKYPFAGFYGKLISNFNPKLNKPQKVTVKGKFTIHGVSNTITVTGTLQKTEKGLKLHASWKLNMTDYHIKPPGILFYRVSEVVDITIDALLPPK